MHLDILLLTLRVALIATLINIPIAIAISWILVKKKVRFGIILDTLVSLPLALPPVAIGFLLLLAFGREGPKGKIINLIVGVDIVFTWMAAVVASAVVSFPLVTRSIMVAMGWSRFSWRWLRHPLAESVQSPSENRRLRKTGQQKLHLRVSRGPADVLSLIHI